MDLSGIQALCLHLTTHSKNRPLCATLSLKYKTDTEWSKWMRMKGCLKYFYIHFLLSSLDSQEHGPADVGQEAGFIVTRFVSLFQGEFN